MQVKKTPAILPNVIALSGSRVELAHWINLSWFLPPTFERKRIVESDGSLQVFGQEEVYKFPLQANARTFQEQWREACDEIKDHEYLAPGLYRGVRCLRWIDDEPHWLTDAPISEPDPYFAPADADEAVVVLRAVSPNSNLFETISRDRNSPEQYLKRLAGELYQFYSRQAEGAGIRFINDGDEFLLRRRQYWQGLIEAAREHQELLRPPLRAALEEISAFISRFISDQRLLFDRRGEEGKVVNSHGNLLASNISFQSDINHFWLLNRAKRSSQIRRQDSLADICSLIADLRIGEQHEAADYFENYYASISGENPDEQLFGFFVATAALRRVVKLLIPTTTLPRRDPKNEEAEKILATAYRYHLGLRKPIVIGIAGKDSVEKRALAADVACLANTACVSVADDTRNSSITESLSGAVYHNLDFSSGNALVIQSEFNRRVERVGLAAFAERSDADCLFVQCDLSREEQLSRSGDSESLAKAVSLEAVAERSRSWDRQILGKDYRIMHIDPVIPSELLATEVMRAVASRPKRFPS